LSHPSRSTSAPAGVDADSRASTRIIAARDSFFSPPNLAPSIRPLYEFGAEACGASQLVDGRDWRDLAAGQIDVAFVCSPPLIWLTGAVEAIAAPVLRDTRFRGRPLYCSEVVVAREASYNSLEDLRDARWAYNDYSSVGTVVAARAPDPSR
jgi:hypothetical protein